MNGLPRLVGHEVRAMAEKLAHTEVFGAPRAIGLEDGDGIGRAVEDHLQPAFALDERLCRHHVIGQGRRPRAAIRRSTRRGRSSGPRLDCIHVVFEPLFETTRDSYRSSEPSSMAIRPALRRRAWPTAVVGMDDLIPVGIQRPPPRNHPGDLTPAIARISNDTLRVDHGHSHHGAQLAQSGGAHRIEYPSPLANSALFSSQLQPHEASEPG